MKKLIASAFVAALLAGGAGVAEAKNNGANAGGNPGPNGANNHGLCTAYFNGSDTGRANKHKAGPFAALEAVADDGDADTTPEQDVWAWCSDLANNPKGIGGTPTDPNA